MAGSIANYSEWWLELKNEGFSYIYEGYSIRLDCYKWGYGIECGKFNPAGYPKLGIGIYEVIECDYV